MLQTQVNGSGKNLEFQHQHRQRATGGRLPIQDFRQAMLSEMLIITRYRRSFSGYTVSYGTGEENGVTAAAGETATLHVTNTRAITLQIEKQWGQRWCNESTLAGCGSSSDLSFDKSKRSSDSNLTLQVTPETVPVGVNGTATVTANKKITVKEIANDTIANADYF